MTQPKKPERVKNYGELINWDKYVNNLPSRQAALLPLNVDIDKTGKVVRSLMKASVVKSFYNNHKKHIPCIFRTHTDTTPTMTDFPNLDKVVDKYLNVMGSNKKSGQQSLGQSTPLDIHTNRPTYMLFRLSKRDRVKPESAFVKWRFSEDKQITCHNDGLGPMRNVLPICTLDDGKALLALNRHRSNPPTMKFDLHVTIHQKANIGTPSKPKWIDASTPIIIDPVLGNSGSGLP